MNPSLLVFYSGRSSHSDPGHSFMPIPSAPEAVVLANPSKLAHHVGQCSHAAKTGCTLPFRGHTCCRAVEGHECDPPKEIWQKFASGGNGYAVTMAQVRIANGCHL